MRYPFSYYKLGGSEINSSDFEQAEHKRAWLSKNFLKLLSLKTTDYSLWLIARLSILTHPTWLLKPILVDLQFKEYRDTSETLTKSHMITDK